MEVRRPGPGVVAGENLVHIARYIADAEALERSPIAGDLHTWRFLLGRWNMLDDFATIANAVQIAGLVIMVGALALMLRRMLRHAP